MFATDLSIWGCPCFVYALCWSLVIARACHGVMKIWDGLERRTVARTILAKEGEDQIMAVNVISDAEKNLPIVKEVDDARKTIQTDDYAMSIGEWISLYQDAELDIHPEFQRFFRWKDQQKSKLIESILLGIPLPPIYVSQRKDGVWDVVDGLQRLATIFEFVGILKDENGEKLPPLSLHGTEYLPSLKGMKWESEDGDRVFPDSLRRILKRSKIHVSIIIRESDESAIYDLFQRLNTGGSHLSAQEVRNCILVGLNNKFYKWLENIRNNESFQETLALSKKLTREAYDMELVLRFLIFSDAPEDELSNIGDVGDHLTAHMRSIATDENFNRQYWQERFEETFSVLQKSTGDNSFKRYNYEKDRYDGPFLVSQFEAISCGVSWNLSRETLRDDLAEAIQGIWSERQFANFVAGVNAAKRLQNAIPFSREYFKKP